jgi:hypothetical protein
MIRRFHPLRTALLVYAAVITLLVTAARAVVRAAPVLLVAGLVVAAAIIASRRTPRPARPVRDSALRADLARALAEAEALRHQLAHARESAERAWDAAAASQPPRTEREGQCCVRCERLDASEPCQGCYCHEPEPGDTARLALIEQPYSGVRPLGEEDGWR